MHRIDSRLGCASNQCHEAGDTPPSSSVWSPQDHGKHPPVRQALNLTPSSPLTYKDLRGTAVAAVN